MPERRDSRTRLRLIAATAVLIASFGVTISGTAVAAPEPNQVSEKDCDDLLETFRATYKGIPEDLRGMSTDEANRFAKRIEKATSDTDQFLRSCPTLAAVPEVHYYKMKFLHLMSTRVRFSIMSSLPKVKGRVQVGALDRALQPYYRSLQFHADKAYAGLPKGHEFRSEALEIRAWAFYKLKDHPNAQRDYNEYLTNYPESGRKADITSSLARVYLDVKAYDRGIDIVKKALKDPAVSKSDTYPHLGDLLWKLNEAKGDFDGMSQAADLVLKIFPMQAKRRKPGQGNPRTAEMFERTIDVSGFRSAYVKLASGQYPEALQAFRKHVATIDKKEDVLKRTAKQLKPVSSIYRERSRKTADFIENHVGKTAPMDFELQDRWTTEKKTTLARSKGKVIALIFRGVGDVRSAIFLEELDRFCAKDKSLELVTISYLHSAKNIDEQIDRGRDELLEIGYENAAGFDPDMTGKSLFRAYGAYVGSATFLIFDTNGHPAWFQQDPRTVDINLAKRILERLRDNR
jgi:tetratricopeptide (TPR) repeat protein